MSFFFVTIAVAAFIFVIVASGASHALRYYRGRWEIEEKRATGTIAAANALLVFSILDIQHFISGMAGELIGVFLDISIVITAFLVVVHQLKLKL